MDFFAHGDGEIWFLNRQKWAKLGHFAKIGHFWPFFNPISKYFQIFFQPFLVTFRISSKMIWKVEEFIGPTYLIFSRFCCRLEMFEKIVKFQFFLTLSHKNEIKMVEGVKYWRKFSKKRAKNGRNSAIKLAILANFWCQNGEIGQKKSGNTV